MTPGELLKHYRELAELSQPRLAALAGTSDQQISRLELGQRPFTEKWRKRLAVHLGIQPEDLAPDATRRSSQKMAAVRAIDQMSDDQVEVLLPFLTRRMPEPPAEHGGQAPKKLARRR